MTTRFAVATRNIGLLAALAIFPATALADIVRVTITGVVESNSFTSGTFAGVRAADPVVFTFDVDSANFVSSPSPPLVNRVRGYPVIQSSFSLRIGSVNAQLLGTPPFNFVIRNNDPGVDGFFISAGTDIDTAIPLAMTPTGYGIEFSRTFDVGSIFPSLNILDALGSYGFEHISSYNFNIARGEFSTPLIMEYRTISLVNVTPVCPTITTQPGAVAGCPQVASLLTLVATGGAPLGYRWQVAEASAAGGWTDLAEGTVFRDGVRIGAAHNPTQAGMTFRPDATLAAALPAVFRCVVSNACGSVSSSPATVTVTLPCSIADLAVGGACPDGIVDGSDFVAFVNSFSVGNIVVDPAADVDGDGIIDGNDYIAFVNAFSAGC